MEYLAENIKDLNEEFVSNKIKEEFFKFQNLPVQK